MGKRKIPFKTNLDQPTGKAPETPSKRPLHTHNTKGRHLDTRQKSTNKSEGGQQNEGKSRSFQMGSQVGNCDTA